MKIYSEDKTKELKESDIDYNKGYLKNDVLETIIPAVKEVKEEGHYETIKEYSNGGKDVEWVVDVPGAAAQDEQKVEENIYVYVLYTEEELKEIESKKLVSEAQQYLQNTDYIANKIIEYQVLNKELDNDYTDVLIKREEARQVIRDYEKKEKV